MIFCAGVVREKCRVWGASRPADRRSSFDENILKLRPLLQNGVRVTVEGRTVVLSSNWWRRSKIRKSMMAAVHEPPQAPEAAFRRSTN